MSLSSTACLGVLRLQAQDRADLDSSPNITTPMWNQYLSLEAKELYDLLIGAYGNDYSVQTPYQFQIPSTGLAPLPADFYKLLGVDLQYSSSPTGWVSLERFEFIDRNKFSSLSPAAISGTARIWYIPEPTSLQFVLVSATTAGSAVVTVSDVTPLTVGMSAAGAGIPDGATIQSINAVANQVTLSGVVQVTQPVVPLFFWTDATTIDGISGWEEYVILGAAIKAQIKQEQPIGELVTLKDAMKKRIEAMAEARDAGQAHHVSDLLSLNTSSLSLGGANLKYRLTGSQIQFVPCASSVSDSGGMYGGLY